jgi:hypothetical protein
MTAAEIMVPSHPLYNMLVQFCGDKEVTKRQARKFLQKWGARYRG